MFSPSFRQAVRVKHSALTRCSNSCRAAESSHIAISRASGPHILRKPFCSIAVFLNAAFNPFINLTCALFILVTSYCYLVLCFQFLHMHIVMFRDLTWCLVCHDIWWSMNMETEKQRKLYMWKELHQCYSCMRFINLFSQYIHCICFFISLIIYLSFYLGIYHGSHVVFAWIHMCICQDITWWGSKCQIGCQCRLFSLGIYSGIKL